VITEQRYCASLYSAAQTDRPGFVIDIEPQERHDGDVATNRLFDWGFGHGERGSIDP
jgi:hypothetical protein